MFDDLARHIAYVARPVLDRNVRKIQPTQQAQAKWVDLAMSGQELTEPADFQARCMPSYYNNKAAPGGRKRNL